MSLGSRPPAPPGMESPVLSCGSSHFTWRCALGPACFLSQPGLAGVTELSAPSLLLGAPFLILASTQSAPQMPSVHLQRTHSCSHSCRGDRALWPCQQLSGGQGVFLVVALPSRCAQQLETLSPLPLQPPFSLSTWTNWSLVLKIFLDC